MKPEDLIAYVDVDDTLVRSVGSTRIPMPAVIEHVRHLHESGVTLYCWSAGGADYARASAGELGIEDLFESFLPKPQLMIDDQPPSAWPHLVVAGPVGLASQTIDDHIASLARRRRAN
ncbi:MAG: hypothetical protein ACI90M_002034 [Candidatus Azotimanducaceae bacterium]|jgi:hypothetical protein